MLIKLRHVDLVPALRTVPQLVEYLFDGGNRIYYWFNKDIAPYLPEDERKLIDRWAHPTISPDVTSGGTPVVGLREIRNGRDGKQWFEWSITVWIQEEIYESEMYECDFEGGGACWKIRRQKIEPFLRILRRFGAEKWRVTFDAQWIPKGPSIFPEFRTEGNPTSWLLPSTLFYELCDKLSAFPKHGAVRVN